jgi:hypothetical protein
VGHHLSRLAASPLPDSFQFSDEVLTILGKESRVTGVVEIIKHAIIEACLQFALAEGDSG